MISFFFAVIGLIIIACVIHMAFIKGNKELFIPVSIGESDLWQDGEVLKYYYHGRWYEAVAKDANKVYIFDEANGQLIGVPYDKNA